MKETLDDSTILITGGSGSLGNALVEEISKFFKPRKVIIFSRGEFKQHQMRQKYNYPWLRYLIGDVRDKDRLIWAFRNVDYVIHAAAIKQIGAAEYNPLECIKTNIDGSANVIKASMRNDIKRAILISSDKGCQPVNLYGATKMVAEKLFLASNSYQHTEFRVIRYGNVIGSRGSVVELFLKLKEERARRFPITNPDMTRFFWTLEQAANAVIKALLSNNIPPIIIPRLPSMKITDLARAISPDCEFEIIGTREGEKIHESLEEGYDSDKNTWWLKPEDIQKMLDLEPISA